MAKGNSLPAGGYGIHPYGWLTTPKRRVGFCFWHPSRRGVRLISPPLCKGRWHFRKKMTEGLCPTAEMVRIRYGYSLCRFFRSFLAFLTYAFPFRHLRRHLPPGGRRGSNNAVGRGGTAVAKGGTLLLASLAARRSSNFASPV